MPSSKKRLLLLLAVFFLSVLVRIPTLNRPLSKHHEFCTAVALRVLQIWDSAGISTYNFNPVMTYPGYADKFINNHASGSGEMMDENGNYYYVSHPPLAYYLPFFVFKILRIHPDVLPLELFNLGIHFLCGLGVYLILMSLISHLSVIASAAKQSHQYSNYHQGIASGIAFPQAPHSLAMTGGFTAYIFSPGTLWFHSNVYMADTLVQLFFIYGVYSALKFSSTQKNKWLALLALCSFLMIYTSWLGVFFCITIISLSIWKGDFKQAIIVFACAAASLLLIIFQYSQIAGIESLKQEWLIRLSERSGRGSFNIAGSLLVIIKNYLTSYLPLIIAVFVLLIFSFRQILQLLRDRLNLFILISIVPVVSLHIVLSNYSGHDFTTLYGGLFLSVLFGVIVYFTAQKVKLKWIAVMLCAFVSLSVFQYYYINRPGEISLRGDRYDDFYEIGKSIREQSSADEVIFLKGMKPLPEIVFYAKRNIRHVESEDEVVNFLRNHQREKGIVFQIADGNHVEVVRRISSGS